MLRTVTDSKIELLPAYLDSGNVMFLVVSVCHYVCLFTGRRSSLSPCDKSHGNPQPWLPGPVQTCSRRDPSPCPPTAFWPPCCLL